MSDYNDTQTRWRFYSADFSRNATADQRTVGSVTLIRAPVDRARWHNMSEEHIEDPNGPPLYVIATGYSLDEAIENAFIAASRAAPIIDA